MGINFSKFTEFHEIPENLLEGLIKTRIENRAEYIHPLDVEITNYENELKNLRTPDYLDQKTIQVIGHVNENVVGYALLKLNTGSQNRKNTRINVVVRSEHRKKGYGRQLLKRICEEIPEEVEDLLFTIYPFHQDIKNYIERYPIKLGMVDRRSASDLRQFDPETVEVKASELKRDAEAKGFEFIKVVDYNFPDGFDIEKYLKVLEQIWNDMPIEDLTVEDERISLEHFDKEQERQKINGWHNWLIIAIHKSGSIAGLSDIYLKFELPKLIHQGDTGVVREFRGNKLGLTMKYMMLEWIFSDQRLKASEYILTHNAHSNSHMIAINNKLGYKESGLINEYEIKKKALLQMI